ncbi:MAG: sulfatase-like hydrolase/transferase [Verrucomicrobiota bacterium]
MKPLLLALALATTALHAASKPNILFIYADDQSHRTVSCYEEAHPWVKTPHIDALAKRGVRFTHAYIGTWCMPSRATMLTGLHPYAVQTMRMDGPYPASTYDPARCRFWPAEFRRHGYVTAQIGKWHTGTDTGAGRDWDHQLVWNRPGFPENAGNYYKDQMISSNGAPAKLISGYPTDNYTQWAIDFINGQHRDPAKPWYLWLCYGATHGPYTPAARHQQDYPGAKVPTPPDIYPPRAGKPPWMQKIETWVQGESGAPILKADAKKGKTKAAEKTLSDWVRQYNQTARALDEGVGKVLAALEASGQLKNTLVVYTADQGFAWGYHGFRHKLAPYDENMRAPFIVSMPGTIPEGKVCRSPVGGADLVPTFFRFAGLDLPWPVHGHDLTPLLKDPSATWPHPTLLIHTADHYGADTDHLPPLEKQLHNGVPWWVFLVDGRYKYIRTLVPGEIDELYDLQSDPDELKNLALDPKHSATLKKFRAATIAELKRTNAGFVSTLPPLN